MDIVTPEDLQKAAAQLKASNLPPPAPDGQTPPSALASQPAPQDQTPPSALASEPQPATSPVQPAPGPKASPLPSPQTKQTYRNQAQPDVLPTDRTNNFSDAATNMPGAYQAPPFAASKEPTDDDLDKIGSADQLFQFLLNHPNYVNYDRGFEYWRNKRLKELDTNNSPEDRWNHVTTAASNAFGGILHNAFDAIINPGAASKNATDSIINDWIKPLAAAGRTTADKVLAAFGGHSPIDYQEDLDRKHQAGLVDDDQYKEQSGWITQAQSLINDTGPNSEMTQHPQETQLKIAALLNKGNPTFANHEQSKAFQEVGSGINLARAYGRNLFEQLIALDKYGLATPGLFKSWESALGTDSMTGWKHDDGVAYMRHQAAVRQNERDAANQVPGVLKGWDENMLNWQKSMGWQANGAEYASPETLKGEASPIDTSAIKDIADTTWLGLQLAAEPVLGIDGILSNVSSKILKGEAIANRFVPGAAAKLNWAVKNTTKLRNLAAAADLYYLHDPVIAGAIVGGGFAAKGVLGTYQRYGHLVTNILDDAAKANFENGGPMSLLSRGARWATETNLNSLAYSWLNSDSDPDRFWQNYNTVLPYQGALRLIPHAGGFIGNEVGDRLHAPLGQFKDMPPMDYPNPDPNLNAHSQGTIASLSKDQQNKVGWLQRFVAGTNKLYVVTDPVFDDYKLRFGGDARDTAYGFYVDPSRTGDNGQGAMFVRKGFVDNAVTHEASHGIFFAAEPEEQAQLMRNAVKYGDPDAFIRNNYGVKIRYQDLPDQPSTVDPHLLSKQMIATEMAVEGLKMWFNARNISDFTGKPGLLRSVRIVAGKWLERMGLPTGTFMSRSDMGISPYFADGLMASDLWRRAAQGKLRNRIDPSWPTGNWPMNPGDTWDMTGRPPPNPPPTVPPTVPSVPTPVHTPANPATPYPMTPPSGTSISEKPTPVVPKKPIAAAQPQSQGPVWSPSVNWQDVPFGQRVPYDPSIEVRLDPNTGQRQVRYGNKFVRAEQLKNAKIDQTIAEQEAARIPVPKPEGDLPTPTGPPMAQMRPPVVAPEAPGEVKVPLKPKAKAKGQTAPGQLELPLEQIALPAVRWKDGKIYTGVTHGTAADQGVTERGIDWEHAKGQYETGFTTNTGRFVSDEEGLRIAKAAKQTGEKRTSPGILRSGEFTSPEVAALAEPDIGWPTKPTEEKPTEVPTAPEPEPAPGTPVKDSEEYHKQLEELIDKGVPAGEAQHAVEGRPPKTIAQKQPPVEPEKKPPQGQPPQNMPPVSLRPLLRTKVWGPGTGMFGPLANQLSATMLAGRMPAPAPGEVVKRPAPPAEDHSGYPARGEQTAPQEEGYTAPPFVKKEEAPPKKEVTPAQDEGYTAPPFVKKGAEPTVRKEAPAKEQPAAGQKSEAEKTAETHGHVVGVVGSEFGEVDNPVRGGYTEAGWNHGAWGDDLSGENNHGVALPPSILKHVGYKPGDANYGKYFNSNYVVRIHNPKTGAVTEAPLKDLGPGASTGALIDMLWGTRKDLGLPTNFKGGVNFEIVDKKGNLVYQPTGHEIAEGGGGAMGSRKGLGTGAAPGAAAGAGPGGVDETAASVPTVAQQAGVKPAAVEEPGTQENEPSGGGFHYAPEEGGAGMFGGMQWGQQMGMMQPRGMPEVPEAPGVPMYTVGGGMRGMGGGMGLSYMPAKRGKGKGWMPEEEGEEEEPSTLGQAQVKGFAEMKPLIKEGSYNSLVKAQKIHQSKLSPDDNRVQKQTDGTNQFRGTHFVQNDPLHRAMLEDLPQNERMALATAQTAIANKKPMHISYISAPPDKARQSTITRAGREVHYDESSPQARMLGQTNARLAGESFIPIDIGIGKNRAAGLPQKFNGYIRGISASVTAHNHQKINEELAAMGQETPYPEVASRKFRNDMTGYVQNLMAGHRSTGEGYQISTPEFASKVDKNYVPYRLKQREADFINAVINNQAVRHQPKLQELAREAGTLLTSKGEVNPIREAIDARHGYHGEMGGPDEQRWSKHVLEPSIRTYNAALVHATHATPEAIPEEIRPQVPGYELLTKTLGRELVRGLQHEKGRAIGVHFMPAPLTPEEHQELTGNIRKQFLSGKLRQKEYVERLHDVPEPGQEIGGGIHYMPMAGPRATGFEQAGKEGRVFRTPFQAGERRRFEIDDRDMEFKPDPSGKAANALELRYQQAGRPGFRNQGTMPLAKAIDHPELFKNYPWLKNTRISMDPTIGHDGHYEQPWLDPDGNPHGDHIVLREPDNKGVLAHEIQHAVQHFEKFAGQGANADQIAKAMSRDWATKDELRKQWEANNPERVEDRAHLQTQLNQSHAAPGMPEYQRLAAGIRGHDRDRDWWIRNRILDMAYAAYEMDPGEIEARVAGRRAARDETLGKGEYENLPPEEEIRDEMRKAAARGRAAGTMSEVPGIGIHYMPGDIVEDPDGVREKIKSAAIRAGGKLYTGFSHAAASEDIPRHVSWEPEDEGFVTHSGRFFNREDAWKIANKATQAETLRREEALNQAHGRASEGPPELWSEDINAPGQIGGIHYMPAKLEPPSKAIQKRLGPRPEDEEQGAIWDRIAGRMAKEIPGAVPLRPYRNKKGLLVADEKGNPKYETEDYDIANAPMLQKQGKALGFDQKGGVSKAPPGTEDQLDPEDLYYLKHNKDGTPSEDRLRVSHLKQISAVSSYADKLVDFFHSVKDDPEVMKAAGWYPEVEQMLKEHFGEHANMVAHILAATSAGTGVRPNFTVAMNAVERYLHGDFKDMIDLYRKGYQMKNEGTLRQHILDAGIHHELPKDDTDAMARYILHHNLNPVQLHGAKYGFNSKALMKVLAETWLEEAEGPKTPNYGGNLSGRTLQATIDMWAARTMRRLGYEGHTDKPWLLGAPAETGVTNVDFGLSQLAFREAAERLHMEPRVLQAILWFGEQKHYQNQGWEKPTDPAERDYRPMLKELMKHGPLTTHLPGKEPKRPGGASVRGHMAVQHFQGGGEVQAAGPTQSAAATTQKPIRDPYGVWRDMLRRSDWSDDEISKLDLSDPAVQKKVAGAYLNDVAPDTKTRNILLQQFREDEPEEWAAHIAGMKYEGGAESKMPEGVERIPMETAIHSGAKTGWLPDTIRNPPDTPPAPVVPTPESSVVEPSVLPPPWPPTWKKGTLTPSPQEMD